MALPLWSSRHVHAYWICHAGDRKLPSRECLQRFDEELLLAFALEPWVGGVWAGHLPMARRMAMASLERTASSVPTSTLETQALE